VRIKSTAVSGTPISLAMSARSTCGFCVPAQTVIDGDRFEPCAASSLDTRDCASRQSASAHDGPIDACS
jgi:hypothetical protein